jgi:ribosomal-protein-alanine N-acetyltransferase
MVHILHAGPNDAYAMAKLHKLSFAHPWDENALRNLMDKPGALALAAFEPPHELVGFVLSRQAADESEILTIATDPGKRRKGIAASLLSHMLELTQLRGAQRVFLEVSSNNKGALALYDHFGFEEIDRRKGYYNQGGAGGEDALVMALELEG